MTIRAKPLPAISSTVAPDLRRFLDRLRETFEDPNGLVTKTELLDTGAFKNPTVDATPALAGHTNPFIFRDLAIECA